MGVKNYSKAAEYYKLAMRDPEIYQQSYYKLARAYAMAQDWDSAKSCYEAMLEKDPDNMNLKLSVAYITAMRGQSDEAIEMFKKLNEENSHVQSVLENYIALLLFVGRAEDAEPLYFSLKEKFPDSSKIKDFSKQLSESIDNFVDSDGKSSGTDEPGADSAPVASGVDDEKNEGRGNAVPNGKK